MAWQLSRRSRVSLVCLALFGAAMAGAICWYPGGSWQDPQATAHSFFENFWCDLLRDPAHNGRPNRTSVVLATLAFVALAAALIGFWPEVARLLPTQRQRFVRIAGSISAVATALVAVLPSDRFPALHAPAVLTAGSLGFACGCVCSGWALAHYRRVPAFALASLWLMVTAAVNLVQYVRVSYLDAPDSVLLPTVQKLATLGLLVWMAAGLAASANHPKP